MSEDLVIDVVADFVCPWCYVGGAALDQALERLNVEAHVRHRPFQLNPDTPVAGADRLAHYQRKFPDAAQREAARVRIIAAGRAAGIDFDPATPRILPNTLLAHRAAALAAAIGPQKPFVDALFKAYWSGDCDLGDIDAIAAVADTVGLDGAVLARLLRDGAAQDDVQHEITAFARAGVTGVPTFIVNETVGFSGALPAETLAEAISEAARRSRPR